MTARLRACCLLRGFIHATSVEVMGLPEAFIHAGVLCHRAAMASGRRCQRCQRELYAKPASRLQRRSPVQRRWALCGRTPAHRVSRSCCRQGVILSGGTSAVRRMTMAVTRSTFPSAALSRWFPPTVAENGHCRCSFASYHWARRCSGNAQEVSRHCWRLKRASDT
jgi:hypothetical protein